MYSLQKKIWRRHTLTKLQLPLIYVRTCYYELSYVSLPFVPTIDVTSHLPRVRKDWLIPLVCNRDVQCIVSEIAILGFAQTINKVLIIAHRAAEGGSMRP